MTEFKWIQVTRCLSIISQELLNLINEETREEEKKMACKQKHAWC